MTAIEKLVSISSPAILDPPSREDLRRLGSGGGRKAELAALLGKKNGFYAFESALHVFPLGRSEGIMDVETWNSGDLWRCAYDHLEEGFLSFAEDVFGCQFCILSEHIGLFDPENGEIEEVAADLESWARAILDHFKYLTGYPIAHQWQEENGPIPKGKRLLPKVPFTLKGEYEIGNLYAGDALEGMRFRGDLARQIQQYPDGSKVRIIIKR